MSNEISHEAWERAAAKKAKFVQWEDEAYPDVYRHYYIDEDVTVSSEEAQAETSAANEVSDEMLKAAVDAVIDNETQGFDFHERAAYRRANAMELGWMARRMLEAALKAKTK